MSMLCPCPCGPSLPLYPTPCCPPASLLTAAGNGEEVLGIINPTVDIPFAPTLYAYCPTIAHEANSPFFTVLEAGEYQITYQIAADNPVIDPTLPIDVYVRLMSDRQGTLDTVHFTSHWQWAQRTITVCLSAGERIYLQGFQPVESEMAFRGQAIAIAKRC